MKIRIAFILCFLFISYQFLNAQQPPCMFSYHGLTYRVEKLNSFPPISPGMPLETLIGYIVLDTVCKNKTREEVSEFLDRQTDNDTINYILKYSYNVVDFNPILFFRAKYHCDTIFKIEPGILSDLATDAIFLKTNQHLSNHLLNFSDIIAHVYVTDTLSRLDLSAKLAKTASIVTCQILDTIKGKVLPACKDISIIPQNLIKKYEDVDDLNEFSGDCIQFEYRHEWQRDQSGLTLIDSLGNPWVQKGKEYIVFLKLVLICSDEEYYYFFSQPYLE